MPEMLGENTKTAMPVAERGAVTLMAQIQPENAVAGVAPAQDPGEFARTEQPFACGTG